VSELFDEIAQKLGIRPEPVSDATRAFPQVPPSPPPAPPPPRPRPYPRPPASAPAGLDPHALLHRHLDEVAGTLHRHLVQMEARLMSALDNLNAQISNVEQTFTGTVGPALAQLAAQASAGGSGISEADVQAAADKLSTIASSMASATQTALTQAATPAASAPAVSAPTVAS
jgi:hypothetical protein